MNLDWTERALSDLEAIDHWLCGEADSGTALAQMERIRLRARRLRDFPRIGPRLAGETRSASVAKTSYILIYRVLSESVQILRIRHHREDWRDE